MPPLRSIAFVVNEDKTGAPALADELMAVAREAGVDVSLTGEFPLPAGHLRGRDACVTIGGDGTLLGVVDEAAREQVPVLGINRGSLGFLTTLPAEEARARFAAIIAGDYGLAERALLECSSADGPACLGLNDVLIKDGSNSRLVRLEVVADGEFVTDYLCDGLIFSSPTGSTAYNLSAGGPLIQPGADVFVMTPICPHTLSNRSIIFKQSVRLQVRTHRENSCLAVAVDGQRLPDVGCEDIVEISVAPTRLRLIQQPGHSHFSVVRTKLKWNGGASDTKR
ncbi:MAG: NAD(+)/NADH kinase [Verrucomicrobiota bacterium]